MTFFAATPCWRDPTRSKQMSTVAFWLLVWTLSCRCSISLAYFICIPLDCATRPLPFLVSPQPRLPCPYRHIALTTLAEDKRCKQSILIFLVDFFWSSTISTSLYRFSHLVETAIFRAFSRDENLILVIEIDQSLRERNIGMCHSICKYFELWKWQLYGLFMSC